MGDSGDILMGMSGSDFRTLKDNSTVDQVKEYINALSFNEYTMIVKAKTESNPQMGGEMKIKHYSVKTMPMDYKFQN